MWTWASTLVPRSSSRLPIRAKATLTAEGSCAATAFAAPSSAWPVCPPFWCSTNTAKISPKSIPAAISAMPPNTSKRRAPMADNVAAEISVMLIVAIVSVADSRGGCLHVVRLVRGSCLCARRTERRHHMFGEHVLYLDALPVLQPAKVRDDRQFPDAAFCLQRTDLID